MIDRDKITLKNKAKILIINLGGIGDILLSVPAIRAIKQRYPRVKITILTREGLKDFALSLGIGDEIIPWQDKITRNISTLAGLRRRKLDLAINMRTLASLSGALKMAFVFRLINPGIKMGRDTDGRGFFFDVKIEERYSGGAHELDYNRRCARAAGADNTQDTIIIPATQNHITQVDVLLARHDIRKDDIVVGIHPGAGAPSQMWPPRRFARLGRHLRDKYNAKIIITGTKNELHLFKAIENEIPGVIDAMSYCLEVNSLAVLIKHMRLYITNDSGPMHVAASLRAPLIAIFGPGDLNHYDPRRLDARAIVIGKPHICAPCNKVRCRRPECLKKITVEEVIEAAEKILGAKNG